MNDEEVDHAALAHRVDVMYSRWIAECDPERDAGLIQHMNERRAELRPFMESSQGGV